MKMVHYQGTITPCNLFCNFVVTQVASEIARCNMPLTYKLKSFKLTKHFCCKEALFEVESGSTFFKV